MNEFAIRGEKPLAISADTKELIQAGVSENTLRAYRRALVSLEAWMADGDNAFQLDSNVNESTDRIDQASE